MRVGIDEAVAALCVVAVACYAWPLVDPERTWEFVLVWDDNENFVENNVFRGLSWAHLHAMFTLTIVNVWEPLGWLLKAIVYVIAGLNSRAFRIATLIFHIGAAVVLAKTAALVIAIAHIGNHLADKSRAPSSPPSLQYDTSLEGASYLPGCILSSLVLFVVHPINVEVVAWPSTLPYALAAFLSLLSLVFHCRQLYRNCTTRLSAQSPRAARGASPETETFPSDWEKLVALISPSLRDSETLLSAVFFVAAVLSKSVCIVLPLAIVLVDMLVALPVALARSPRTGGHHFPSPMHCAQLAAQYVVSKLLVFTTSVVFVMVTLVANEEGANQNADLLTLSPSERLVKALMTPAWTMRHFVWPVGLRPHYHLRDNQLELLTNPECLLSVLAFVAFVWWLACRPKSDFRVASLLAVLYFVTMSLPTCGLIQHGMVAQGADRYAYFPLMVLVPIGGYFLTHWLGLAPYDTSTRDDGVRAASVAAFKSIDATRVGTRDRKELLASQKLQSVSRTSRHPKSHKTHARVAYVALLATMVAISNHQMAFWYDSKSINRLSLQLEPSDWRMIDLQYMYQTRGGGGCVEDSPACKNRLHLMYHFAPSKSIKAKLYRYMILFVLGRHEYACEGFNILLHESPHNAMVHNNVGICLFQQNQFAEGRDHIKRAQVLPHSTERERLVIAENFFMVEQWMAAAARPNGDKQPFLAKLVW